MRRFLLTIFLFFATNYIFAQLPSPKVPKYFQMLKKKSLTDTLKSVYPFTNNPYALYKNKMPVLITDNRSIYKGNLGNGLELYSMNIDNMPCITPDSTYQSNMSISQYLKNQKLLLTPGRN
ncbi:MAG: hypothetical protein Q8R77_08765 [Sediminibacterium sp.]|nr:hypothetical protein [Sediminibacterium sp.]